MQKRYLAALAAIIIFFVIGFILIIRSTIKDKPRTSHETSSQPKPASSLNDTKNVTYEVQGKLVGEEDRRAVRIVISPTERRIETIKGYQDTILKTKTWPNNEAAYRAFLAGLKSANFDTYDKNASKEIASLCPTGKGYVYEIDFSNGEDTRNWSTSCGKSQGNFRGDALLTRTLFKGQIPEYQKFVSGTGL